MTLGELRRQEKTRQLTVGEAASIMRCDVESVRRWIREGRLHAITVGRHYRIKPADLDAFQEGREGVVVDLSMS